MTSGEPAVGALGEVTTRIRGPEAPGEVVVGFRGMSESFIAYCDRPVDRGRKVVVVGTRSGRGVDVVEFDG